MSGPDTLNRLEGEPEIPSLTPRPAPFGHKAIVAAGILTLSLVAVLGFVATRYIGKKEPPPAVAADVASATVPRIRFQEPVAVPAPLVDTASSANPSAEASAQGTAQAIALINQSRVPSIEADGGGAGPGAAPIPVRGTAGGPPQRPAVPAGDESPFTNGSAAVSRAPGTTADAEAPSPSGMTGEAQANMRRYQSQLGGMLSQLQGLTDKATGTGNSPGSAAASLATAMPFPGGPTAPLANPALFGTLERSATPVVVASQLGDRRLTLPKGVLFTCSLKTRVISAVSGFVACQVQRNVFSDDGKVVLAERGSHLDGQYRIVQVRPGVTRIPVLWTRLRTPHGVTVDLDSPGTGALGESGIGGYVDSRWPERIGAAMLVSLIDDAVKIAATDLSPDNGSSSATVLLPGTAATGSKLAEKVLEATINIPPLLYQNQGSVVGVYVARDVDFSRVYALEPR